MIRFCMLLVGALAAQPALARVECEPSPSPVVKVAHGSRYTADSKTRSDFDAESNAAVEAALAPMDELNQILARHANNALIDWFEGDPILARAEAACVMRALAVWARADALSNLASVNAKMSMPSRIGGLAFALSIARPLAPTNPRRDAVIDAWFKKRATEIMTFFDDPNTPRRAARNNLRAWAALAVLRIGLTQNDAKMVDWARSSFVTMLCTANKDGSLPLEMERGNLALHYQLHAVAPLTVGAAFLEANSKGIAKECDKALQRVVEFTVAAVADPKKVEKIVGKAQSVKPGISSLKSHEIAWVPAWTSLKLAPDVAKLIGDKAKPSNSKLGGDQWLIWPKEPKSAN